ncbi:MAG: chlorite dismutase family protein [Abditibacteriales bacterium]|nr:chlorite dismutase family protein [Abditibacteriales bacterium]MDW8367221.1 chlorite dismutase family protein [Abditibacteriales bacterium]
MRPERPTEGQAAKSSLPRQFVNFAFFKVDPAWRRLPADERARGKEQFASVIEKYRDRVMTLCYTLVGIRGDCDFLLWRIAHTQPSTPDVFQEMQTELLATDLGKYLTVPYSYLSMTKRSMYLDKHHPQHAESRLYIKPGEHKYLFVYPFVKTRAWYKLNQTTRQGMMDEHMRIGNKYPSVKLNTTYSYGLDDQEFVVAFETDSPQDFLDLVEELRFSDASSYTLRDTPIFTCLARDVKGMLDSLGG